ncbi:MAG: S1-like domain-containing RNA-binding protein [Tenuifilaceae bacterium]|jgi:predicted RNA-binding protein (virulence factor B family)|uniref:CvfB family protein n=1 Tax=Perlabentimonas gracilis TaxID=2715279 RepID=UPI00140A9747|nr:S1-like domain-containing RNA-binding protein [Perlabentimonas gracilis]MDX9769340.1 S1-like domain-containing RNA-binding protein [Tenuifilaceae bacterium]NHB69196.1 GntR family transcriptional regulator [Perlabentimonas gracilis]
MAEIGKTNNLRVVKKISIGCYLDGGEHGEILIPRRYVPEDIKVDEYIDVFIYFDSEDRIIATTEEPKIKLGEIAMLKVVSVTHAGAFLDWGLPKDIFVPFKEQKQRMEVDKWYIVALYIDYETNRLAASAKVDKFIDNTPPEYEVGQEVDILIYNKTDLGYSAIVNNAHWGVIYENEVFRHLSRGKQLKAYIKKIRDDEKIDLILQKPGYEKVDDISKSILDKLEKNNGVLWLTDKSAPEEIYGLLGISKKVFKKAIGALYKAKLITLEEKGIRLVEV